MKRRRQFKPVFSLELAPLDSRTATKEDGSSVLNIISDGKVLKTVPNAAGHKTVAVDFKIQDVNKLEFKLEQTEGTSGYQLVLLMNGFFAY